MRCGGEKNAATNTLASYWHVKTYSLAVVLLSSCHTANNAPFVAMKGAAVLARPIMVWSIVPVKYVPEQPTVSASGSLKKIEERKRRILRNGLGGCKLRD